MNQPLREFITFLLELGALLVRTGKVEGATVVLDRGMSSRENLIAIKTLKMHYVVAARQEERPRWADELDLAEDWVEVKRTPSPANPIQKKSTIEVLKRVRDGEAYVLCLSEERRPKDQAIRETQEKRLLKDLTKLQDSVREGRLKDYGKIHESIGRLKERYPRVARYYEISYAEATGLVWREEKAKKEAAEKLDGSYVLRTDREDLSADAAWRIYSLLTRAGGFRGHEEPFGGASDLSPIAGARTNPHLPLHPGLPPAGEHRENLARQGMSSLLADGA